jgi:hypothetical protein
MLLFAGLTAYLVFKKIETIYNIKMINFVFKQKLSSVQTNSKILVLLNYELTKKAFFKHDIQVYEFVL